MQTIVHFDQKIQAIVCFLNSDRIDCCRPTFSSIETLTLPRADLFIPFDNG